MTRLLYFLRKQFYGKEDKMINNVRFHVARLESDIERMNESLGRVRAIISDFSQG